MARHKTYLDPNLDSTLQAAVRTADDELADILSEAAPRVRAEWTPGNPDADLKPTAQLSLSDAGVTRIHEFTRSEFQERFLLRHRLRQLWQDILTERIRAQRLRVLESLAATGEGS